MSVKKKNGRGFGGGFHLSNVREVGKEKKGKVYRKVPSFGGMGPKPTIPPL